MKRYIILLHIRKAQFFLSKCYDYFYLVGLILSIAKALRKTRKPIPSLVSEGNGEIVYMDNEHAELLVGHFQENNDVNTAATDPKQRYDIG